MSHMYETNSAKTIKVGIISTNFEKETNSSQQLASNLNIFLNENILHTVKICPNFTLKTNVIANDETIFSHYNFVFYAMTFDKINDNNELAIIKKITESMTDPRNHLFVIVDKCSNLEMNDDGELVFVDEDNNVIFNKFDESISKLTDDKLFHCCKISTEMADIWKKIIDDNSIVNLTDDQINILAPVLVKKSSKMTVIDKKREIKAALKKINKDDKMAETGCTDFSDNVVQYFKLLQQKKIVYQNYLHAFKKINISLKTTDMENINNLLKEIYAISYFKPEMHDDLIDKIDEIFLAKLKQFYEKCKNSVTIEPNQTGKIDAYAYHKFLTEIMEIAKEYNLSNIMEITKQDIAMVNNLITNYHKKEMEYVTDLEKIASYLEIFANKDKNNLNSLFDKIRTHPKIMPENIGKTDKWINFVNKCIKLGIPKDSIIRLMEEIIMYKISFYTENNVGKNVGNNIGNNNKDLDMTVIYPQCLQVFLLPNLDKNFVFKKLYMLLLYNIRYSGRNIADYIKNIRMEQYQELLKLENKLLEYCSTPTEEQSQSMNLSEVDIVETFNENISSVMNNNNEEKQIVKNKINKINKLSPAKKINKESDSEGSNDETTTNYKEKSHQKITKKIIVDVTDKKSQDKKIIAKKTKDV